MVCDGVTADGGRFEAAPEIREDGYHWVRRSGSDDWEVARRRDGEWWFGVSAKKA